MTRSRLYPHADDGDAVTLAMKVRVDFESLSFDTSLVREYSDYQLVWGVNVDRGPEGLDRDGIIQDIADEVGEYF